MALAGMQAQARSLARRGRGGDTEVGHLTRGEVVVPADVLGQPGVKDRLLFGFSRARMPMGRYTVGGRDDSRNPRTGMREYRGGGAEGTGEGGGGQGGEGPGAEDPSEGFSGPGGAADAPSRGGPSGGGRAGPEGRAALAAAQSRVGAEMAEATRASRGRGGGVVSDIVGHITDQVKAVKSDITDMKEKGIVPGTMGIVAQVVDMAIQDMFDEKPATPEQMAAHVADREATGGGEIPAGVEPRGRQPTMTMTAAMPGVDAANPLAALGDTGDEATYWRPQMTGQDVSWLSRVNADIERARRAGRQRPGVPAPVVGVPGGRAPVLR